MIRRIRQRPLPFRALLVLSLLVLSSLPIGIKSSQAATKQIGSAARPPNPSVAERLAFTGSTTALPLPAFSHVFVIVMENREYSSIVGSTSAPYLNSLIDKYGLATQYYGVTHPSEPNYLALFSGSTHGITDDGRHDIAAPNLVDELSAKGKSWKVFAENVPLNCYTGSSANGGEDGSGTYVRKHEPAISFTDISHNASRCARITDLTHFSPSAASFELIVPNLCHDMHDCSTATGDAFLKGIVPTILSSNAWQQGGVLFITWDEGTTSTHGGGHVATLVISKQTPAGYRSSTFHNHYSLLHTIETAWRLGCLASSCTANTLSEFFR